MKATMKQARGTVWGNNVEIELSTELDVPHKLTTAELALSMVLTMQTFVQALREEDDRAIEAGETLTNQVRSADFFAARRRAERAEEEEPVPDRERERLEEMRQARERGDR